MAGVWDPMGKRRHWNPYFSRNLNDWEIEMVEGFLLRLHGKNIRRDEEDGMECMDARKEKFSNHSTLLWSRKDHKFSLQGVFGILWFLGQGFLHGKLLGAMF